MSNIFARLWSFINRLFSARQVVEEIHGDSEFALMTTDSLGNAGGAGASMATYGTCGVTELVADASVLPNVQLPDERSPLGLIKDFAAVIFIKSNIPRVSSAFVLILVNSGVNFLAPYLLAKSIATLAVLPFDATRTITLTATPSPYPIPDVLLEKQVGMMPAIMNNGYVMFAILAGVYTLAQLLPNIRQYLINPVAANIDKKVLMKISEHLLEKKSLQYHVTRSFSDHIFLIQRGFIVSNMYTPLITEVAPCIIEIVVSSIMLSVLYSLEIGLSLMLMLAVYTGYSAYLTKPIINARTESLATMNAAWNALSNAIKKYKTIHDFNQVDYVKHNLQTSLDLYVKANIKALQRPVQIGFGHTAIVGAYRLAILIYAVHKVYKGQLNSQDILVLASYLTQLASLLPAFGSAVNQLAASAPDLKYVFKELAKESEIMNSFPDVQLNIRPVADAGNYIEFNNVSFNYPIEPNKPASSSVLANCSFSIPHGSRVAFVSASGGGKTTIFNLLYRYYIPTSGSIIINGQNIADVGLLHLQSAIGIIAQNPNLFNGTIRDNVKFGASNPAAVTDELILEIADRANLLDFLRSFERGLDTEVGEDGKSLSGGQQQRVAILRALLKPCDIYLLDEISASLDSDSAQSVQDGVRRVLHERGATTLVITHKLTEIQDVERIFVLERGSILAQGMHEELLVRCGLYRELWEKYHRESRGAVDVAAGTVVRPQTFMAPRASCASVSGVDTAVASYSCAIGTGCANR